MQHNLIPPSHFDEDSLNPSPLSMSSGKSQHLVNKESNFRNAILKTPNDFCMPKQTVQRQLLAPKGRPEPTENIPQNMFVPSYDSGYDWEKSKVDFTVNNKAGSSEELLQLINALRHENKNFQNVIEKNLSGKESSCNYNVISHQVLYIERLQQDLASNATKLNVSENQVSKLNFQLQEKDIQLKEKVLKLSEVMEDLQAEKSNAFKISETVASLNQKTMTLVAEQEKLKQEHESQLVLMDKKYKEELEAIIDQHVMQQKQVSSQFESEKLAWEEKTCKANEECKLELHTLTLEWEKRLDRQKKESDLLVSECEACKEELERKLSNAQRSHEALNEEISSLQQQLEVRDQRAEALEADLKTATDQLNTERESNSQLRAYIARVQVDDHAREQWKAEKENMESKAKALQQQKVEVEKALEMMNVRFNSVSKILAMQEESIAAHTAAIPDVHSQNKAAIVTSQWRSKVFELMVHCKTQEIVAREQTSKHDLIVAELEDRLREQRRASDILTSRSNDLDAQLQFQLHLNRVLEEKKEESERALGVWKEKCDQQQEAVQKLHDVVKTVGETYSQSYESSMTTCFEKCLRMEQRLSFANNRVRTIQALLKRRDSIWRVRVEQASKNESTEAAPAKQAEESPDLQMEILQLMEERDSLSHQLAHDAAQFESTIKSMKSVEDDYKQTIQNLEKQIIASEENMDKLGTRIKELEAKLEDETYDKNCLITEINEAKLSTKQDIENALEEAKQQHCLEMKHQELTLNQVKKDLTKAVVALRQAESAEQSKDVRCRSSVREKNQLTEQLETEKRLSSEQEEKLNNTVRNLQKDNFILMSTIRQEGLLSAVRAARAAPVELEGEETPVKHVHFKSPTPDPSDKPKVKAAEMDKMLQDLTNLSEKVLAHSDSD